MLRRLERYEKNTTEENLLNISEILSSFETEMRDYSYVKNISFYADNGLILSVGQSGNYWLYDKEKTNWFYESDLCNAGNKIGMPLVWMGGYTSRDFGVFEQITESKKLNEKEKKNYYVTGIRKTLMGTGWLVLNVDMDTFYNVFCSGEFSDSENVYMLDEYGKIIMCNEKNLIGEYRKIDGFNFEMEGYQKKVENDVQLFLYPLSHMKMFLVREIKVADVIRDSTYLRNVLLITCLVSIIVSFAISKYAISKKMKPLQSLVVGISEIESGKFGRVLETGPNNEIGVLTEHFNDMSKELKRMFENNQKISDEKNKLEMQALRSQINPHLIYNTMNNIKWMALLNNERTIAESITLLSDFLEPIFKNRSNLCTVEEELKYVENYISIMNLRVAGKYTLEIDVKEQYQKCKLIRFLLQPVVENSILHGIGERTSGKIMISMWNEEETGYIRICDDGAGFSDAVLKDFKEKLKQGEVDQKDGDGVGILNVNRRIKVQYGKQYGLSIENREEGGAEVILKIVLKS